MKQQLINSYQILTISKAIIVIKQNISGLFFESNIHKMFDFLNTEITRHSITEFGNLRYIL